MFDAKGGQTIDSLASIGNELRMAVLGEPDSDTPAVRLLECLQDAHDSWDVDDPKGFEQWKNLVREIALNHGLNTKVLDHAE
jgi:hypothetical protein